MLPTPKAVVVEAEMPDTGNPVQLVNVPDVGVPSKGVTNVGLVANTKAPVPVSSVTADIKLADEGVAKNVATPVPRPLIPVETGRPVQLVNVPELGVPSAGVVNVGLVSVLLVSVCVPVVVTKGISAPVKPAVHKSLVSSQVMLALVDVPRSTSIPAFCEGTPVSSLFNTMMLSPMVTVLLFTVVVVPFTIKSPLNVKLAALTVPVNVGDALNTKVEEPVSSVMAAAKLAELGVAKNVATPVPKPDTPVEMGRPVQLVNVPLVGVPRTGVTNVGVLANTKAPEPVSSVIALAKLALEGVARNVATPVPRPDTPEEMGRPVQLVRVPELGVPSTGVVNVGDVKVLLVRVSVVARPTSVSVAAGTVMVPEAVAAVTTVVVPLVDPANVNPPLPMAGVVNVGEVNVGLLLNTKVEEPVSSVKADARLAELGVARNVATPEPKPLIPVDTGRPVALVNVTLEGVPKAGVTRVGLLANTKAPVPVSSVMASNRLADEGVARNVATPEPKPLIPVDTGNPVQLVNVPELGVPSTGVVKVGDVKVLLVSVCVVSVPTNVVVASGNVMVLSAVGSVTVKVVSKSLAVTPSNTILASFKVNPVTTGLVIVLLVNVCDPVSVATVLSISTVTVLLVTAEVMPVPPTKVNVSEINDTLSVPVSPAMASDELTDAVEAEVTRPKVSMVNTGTAVDDP